MKVQFNPSSLHGTIPAIPSKSASHRALICAALASGRSTIGNLMLSEDILATIDCLTALGAKITVNADTAIVEGVGDCQWQKEKQALLNCRESGSTLRFLIPIAAALGFSAEFTGTGKLPARPITPYLDCMPKNEITFYYNGSMPFKIKGKLSGGSFVLPGNISSQFITGLLFALPLFKKDSTIEIVGAFESKPYVLMTLQMLKKFGIQAVLSGSTITVPGRQEYISCSMSVEGDFSQAAFFLTAGAFDGPVTVTGINYKNSLQGDRQIIDFLIKSGASVTINNNSVTVAAPKCGTLSPISVDARDIPDLVPILSVLAGRCEGSSLIHHAERLRIKESDRLQTTAALLNALGSRAQTTTDGLKINGVSEFKGGRMESFNDHRIAMAAAIAATVCDGPVLLSTAEAVRKSYPDFYTDYQTLGGIVDVIDME